MRPEIGRREAVERGVEPLAPTRKRRVEREHRRRGALLQHRQGRHRAAELDEDPGARGHLLVPVARYDVGDLEPTLDRERVHVVGPKARRGGVHDDPVRLAALPPGEVRLEEQRAAVEPRERALDGRFDGDERATIGPRRRIAEGDREGGEARHVLAAGRDGHGGPRVGNGHAERDVAVAVVPAGAVPIVEEEADLSQRVPVAARDARADVDPKRIVHVLRDANLDAVDRDVAEAVVPAAAEPVVEEQADGPQRVPAATRGASADEEAQGVAHVLPDAHVHVDGVGSGAGIGGGGSGAGDEHNRQQEGAQGSVGRGRSGSHRGSFPEVPARSDRP